MEKFKLSNYFYIISIIGLLFSGCASFNQMATPSAKVIKNEFDNSIEIRQIPVSAASSLTEGWNTLGFSWLKKYPDSVYLLAGTSGITNISAVHFNIDGEIIELNEPSSHLTDYGDWSTRPFIISLENFKKLAKGKTVKMKLVMIDKYNVSTFGQDHLSAVVSGKFSKFIELIELNK